MHGQPDHECILLFIYGNSKQWLCGMLRPKLVFCATEFFFFNETSIPLAFLWAATVFLSFFLVKQNLTVVHFATFFPYYFWSVLMALKTNLLLLPAWVKMAWLHTKIKYIIKRKKKEKIILKSMQVREWYSWGSRGCCQNYRNSCTELYIL